MSIALRQSNGAISTGTLTATMPAWGTATLAGSLLLIFVNETASSNGTWPTLPAGYTAVSTTPFAYDSGNGDPCGIFWKIAAGGDATPGTVGESTGTQNYVVYTYEFTSTNGWPSTPLDTTVHSATSTTSAATKASGSTATLAQADELAVSMAALIGAGTVLTFSGGFTVADPTTNNGLLWIGWQETAATTALSTTASWTTARVACAWVATFKPNSSSAFTASVSDTSASSDAVSTLATLGASVVDTSASADASTTVATLARAVADTTHSTDVVTRREALVRPLADTTHSTDVVTHGAMPFVRSVADTSHSSDAATAVAAAAQQLRPTSDIATTGWAATPLFSKINDQSDSTFITATV